jgi:hypothetical protein
MMNKRIALLGAFACLPLFAQEAFPQHNAEKIAPRQFTPIHDRVDHSDGTSTSTNWSGYAVTGTSFTSAVGSWVVPTATCTGEKTVHYSAFWVGIDGFSSSTVEQTGTDSDCDGATPVYYAWYEFYPNPSIEITSLRVSPGNHMKASVTYSGGAFTAVIENVTTGKSYTKTATVSGAARTSAEWIAEAPCCTSGGGILPLSDFGTGKFGDDYTSVAGTNSAATASASGVIGSFPSASINEINKTGSTSSPETSTCSALSSDGTSFTCTWAK